MIRSLFTWYTDHAVIVFAASALLAASGEVALAVRRRRRNLLHEAGVSVASAALFLGAKKVMERVVMLSLSLWIYRNLRLTTLDLTNPLVWLGAFLFRDHLYYWVHRTEHRVKALWASHLVHHSPEEFGFTTAVRVPWMEAVYKPWLGMWVPLLGFNPLAFVALDAFAATIGQLQHTTACKRRTILDKLFITPSAHRVHHGSNREYLDKNFGAVLCIWDRMYGTYQPETVPVVYGLIGHNPVEDAADTILGGYPELIAAARKVPGFRRRLRYVLSAPGVAA